MDYSYKKDIGHIYENIVYLQLRRKTNALSYFKGKQEVDFCVQTDGPFQLINVSYDIGNPVTREREIEGLKEAMNFFSVNNGLLITSQFEEDVHVEGKKISIIPLWKWLLY